MCGFCKSYSPAVQAEIGARMAQSEAQKTVTVTKVKPYKGPRVTLTFSQLPGKTFGPYPWGEAITDLTVSALLSRVDARALVFDALAVGSATREMGTA